MRPSLNRDTEIKARCTKETKESLTRKLIAIGYRRSRANTVTPNLVDFMEVLANKPLEWFQENFELPLDK
jgi:hypothetical protein